jgi:hypothetical protein
MEGSGYYVAIGKSVLLSKQGSVSQRHLLERVEIPVDLLPDYGRLAQLIESGFIVTERPDPPKKIPPVGRQVDQGRALLSPSMERLYRRWRISPGE